RSVGQADLARSPRAEGDELPSSPVPHRNPLERAQVDRQTDRQDDPGGRGGHQSNLGRANPESGLSGAAGFGGRRQVQRHRSRPERDRGGERGHGEPDRVSRRVDRFPEAVVRAVPAWHAPAARVSQMWRACPATASAASWIASESVGCAWIVRTSSSDVASSFNAAPAAPISSVARGPTMCTPRTSSYFFSPTIFTNPAVSLTMRAFGFAENGNFPTATS